MNSKSAWSSRRSNDGSVTTCKKKVKFKSKFILNAQGIDTDDSKSRTESSATTKRNWMNKEKKSSIIMNKTKGFSDKSIKLICDNYSNNSNLVISNPLNAKNWATEIIIQNLDQNRYYILTNFWYRILILIF